MKVSPAWKKYQEQAKGFFSSLGFNALADVSLQGARAKHKVDVAVTFQRYGIEQCWLVECKLWKTSIPKEKVLAFQSILSDIGADKGFLLSEIGFQAGAVNAAAKTNILLTDLQTLKTESDNELKRVLLSDCLHKCHNMTDEFFKAARERRDGETLIAHVPEKYSKIFGAVCIIEMSLRSAYRDEFPVILDADNHKFAQNAPELLTFTNDLLIRAQASLEEYKLSTE